MALILPMPPERSGEYDGADQGLERRHMRSSLVRHCKAEGMPPHGMDEFAVQRTATGFAEAPGLFSERPNRIAELVRRRVRRQRCAEGHRQWVRNALRPFRKETAVFEAEDAAPHAIQVDGDDRRQP